MNRRKKIQKTEKGWNMRVWLPFEWMPHKHKYIKLGNGVLGNSIYACKWCGKEKRGNDFKI